MSIHNYSEVGDNLQRIFRRLMANQNLMKLLYYTDKDPLNQPDLSEDDIVHNVYQKLLLILPKVDSNDTAQSKVSVRIASSRPNNKNPEFKDYLLEIEIFVPFTQWIIKSDNLRPYLIMGEIQKSLENKVINSVGRIQGGNFDFNFTTAEMTSFIMEFRIISYD